MDSKRDQLKLLGEAFYNRKKEGRDDDDGATVDELQSLKERVEMLEQLCLLMSEFLTNSDNKDPFVLDRSLKAREKDDNTFISTEKIEHFVDEMLADEKTNVGWIPDFIERKLDRRILVLVLGALSKFIKTTSIQVGDDHHLTFTMKPKSDPEQPNGPDGQQPRNPKSIDTIVFKALSEFLETIKVNIIDHEIGFKLN